MFVGNSPEEIALEEEEAGDGVAGFWDKIAAIWKSPAGKTLAISFPVTAAATGTALALHSALKKKPAPAPAPAPPAGGFQRVLAAGEAGRAAGARPAGAGPATSVTAKAAPSARPAVPEEHGEDVMGAEPPMREAELLDLIRREPNPLKRQRMVLNWQRARRR